MDEEDDDFDGDCYARLNVYVSFLIITPMILVYCVNKMLKIGNVCFYVLELEILCIVPF